MRQIKFRGLRVGGKGWAYGDLVHTVSVSNGVSKNHTLIGEDLDLIEVHSDTVGQFTGLKDKNGKDIFENDIIAISSRGFDFDCQITHDRQLIPVGEKSKGWEHMLYSPDWARCEVIGNIHENK